MDFISGMMLGNLLNNTTYHDNSISDFELDSISSQIETQNKIIDKNNMRKKYEIEFVRTSITTIDGVTDLRCQIIKEHYNNEEEMTQRIRRLNKDKKVLALHSSGFFSFVRSYQLPMRENLRNSSLECDIYKQIRKVY